MASSSYPYADPNDRVPHSFVQYSVYLFGLLTNQWCIEEPYPSSMVALLGNMAMIVRIEDESKESTYEFNPDD